MSVVILQDEIVHYEVLGRGKPLVFLHGWVGSWRYWVPAMQAASTSYRTYAIDLWGFGDTAKDPSHYGLEQQVDLLDQFLQEMGIGKIAIIGHGLGALIGALYAIKYRRFVDRLLAVGLPDSGRTLSPRLQTGAPAELAAWLLSRSPNAEPARIEAPKADPQAIQVSLAGLQALDMGKVFAAISTPSLLVYGQNDPVFDSPPLDNNSDLPEHIHRILFEQSGHFPMLDESSKFNRLMADFLTLSSGESPRSLQLKEEWKRRIR